MALKTVDALSALSPGCDLWIVASPESSQWTRKLDWHLNFQIRRAGLHATATLSSDLLRVIEECETIVPPVPAVLSAPLMIASSSLLPNSKTVFVSGGVGEWASSCHKVWSDLGRPLTRVFLPDDVSPEAFSRDWPLRDAGAESVELVAAES